MGQGTGDTIREASAGSYPVTPLRVAVFGDALAGPLTVAAGGPVPERAFRPDSFAAWVPVLDPAIEIVEDEAFARAGDNSVEIAARIGDACARAGEIDAVIVSAGLQDCFAMMRGVAPPAEDTAAAFQTMARRLLEAGIAPVFLVPPPCPDFTNGLFADRYIAIAATPRRLQREQPQISIVDATLALVAPGAYGIEPDPAFATGDRHGNPTPAGAFRLAQAVTEALERLSLRRLPGERGDDGSSIIVEPADLVLDLGHAPGWSARIGPAPDIGSGLRLVLERHAASPGRAMVRLVRTLPRAELDLFIAGSALSATCGFALGGEAAAMVSLSLQALPVWHQGCLALRSSPTAAAHGIFPARAGLLRTPMARLPGAPDRMSVSLNIHIGEAAEAGARIDLAVGPLAVRAARTQANQNSSRPERAAATR